MGRPKTAEKPAERGRAKARHPLFPAVDPAAIATLAIYRLVRGPRGRMTPELLEGPLDPQSVTSDTHLKAYGPGHLRVIARRSDGALLGDAYELRLPDVNGQVPTERSDFDRSNGEAVENEASQLKKLLAEEREHTRAMIQAERDLNAANMASFSAIIDKITESNAGVVERILTASQRSASSDDAGPKWLRDEVRDLRKELSKTQSALHTREIDYFKLESKKNPKTSGDELDIGAMFKKYGPVLDIVTGMLAERQGVPASGAQPDANTYVIDGERVPTPDVLRAVMRQNNASDVASVLSDEAVTIFRRLHGRGLLPPAYIELLGSVLAQG